MGFILAILCVVGFVVACGYLIELWYGPQPPIPPSEDPEDAPVLDEDDGIYDLEDFAGDSAVLFDDAFDDDDDDVDAA